MSPETASQSPYGRPEILQLVQERLADILEVDVAKVTENASFADDLNADSLALIELVEALEADVRKQTPTFRIEDEDLEGLNTVSDAVEYVVAKLENS